MKTQMRFQKYICLAMLLVGALALVYAFCYCSGALTELGQSVQITTTDEGSARIPLFTPAEGKYGVDLFYDVQDFNNLLMIMGIVMILLAVLLYITSCNKRRNYYVSNYVATGVCAVGDIVISLILLVMNASWHAKFLNVDFNAWYFCDSYETYRAIGAGSKIHFAFDVPKDTPATTVLQPDLGSQLWFILGYVVYALVIVAAIVLILNLIWKVLLMKGEKKLLEGSALEGGAV